MNEIKRKVERFLRGHLREQVPGLKVLTSKGGDDVEDGTNGTDVSTVPPFAVVEATAAERMMPSEPTWMVEATVTYVTHIDDASAPEHSRNVRAICDALEELPRGYYPEQTLTVHGTDIAGTDEISDTERQSHGDVVALTVGATG